MQQGVVRICLLSVVRFLAMFPSKVMELHTFITHFYKSEPFIVFPLVRCFSFTLLHLTKHGKFNTTILTLNQDF
jgi:hypothetical protein